MSYISRKQLERWGEPIGDVSVRHGDGRRTYHGGGKGGADAPDYGPLAAASEKAADLSYKLGQDQLEENKRQYDQNTAISKPVSQAQLGLMNMTREQGNDYYNYGRSFRPAEQAMLADAFGVSPDSLAQYQQMRADAEAKANTDRQNALQTILDKIPQGGGGLSDAEKQELASILGRGAGGAGGGKYSITGTNWQTGEDETGAVARGGADGLYGSRDEALRAFRQQLKHNPQPQNPFSSRQMVKYAKGDPSKMSDDELEKWMLDQNKMIAHGGGSGMSETDRSRLAELVGKTGGTDLSSLRLSDLYTPDYSAADTYASGAMANGLAAQRAREQAIIDGQAELDAADRAKITGLMGASNTDIYNQNAGDIETDVGRAVADSRSGYSSAINQALRQGMRYGYSPAKLAAMAGSSAMGNAQMQAQAANTTRNQGITDTRQRLLGAGQAGMQMRQQDFGRNRGYTMQDKATNWAKQLDAIGMGKGMPGASQGAYGLAIQSGNSAVNNQVVPSQAYMGNMNAANQMTMSGQQMRLQGLSNILNSQTSMYNASQGQGDPIMGLVGTGLGAWAGRGFPGIK